MLLAWQAGSAIHNLYDMSFWQLFKTNLRVIYRNRSGIFWTLVMPAFIYIALSILPIGSFLGGQLKYSNYVLPGIVAMTVMQGGIYGLAYWMVDLKTRGVLKRFMVTPINKTELILSLVAARIVVMFIQVLILTLLGVLAFNATFAGNILAPLVLVLLGGSVFLLLGLLISSFADTYDAAAPITAAIGLPLTFLGNIFYPVELLSHGLQQFAKILPITYLADGLRAVYLQPFSFALIAKDAAILAAWGLVILAITIWRFRLKE